MRTALAPNCLGAAASVLADALVAPLETKLDDVVAKRMHRQIERAARLRGGDGRLVVDAFSLRRLPSAPFEWTPRRTRRILGLAILREAIGGAAPGDVVDTVVSARMEEARSTGARPGSLGAWLLNLNAGGLAAVSTEATGWATACRTAVDWERIPERTFRIGSADSWWDVRRQPEIAVRGRADIRIGLCGGTTFLSFLPGWPRPDDAVHLALAALVARKRDPRARAYRIAAHWPEAGRSQVLDFDADLAGRSAAAVCDLIVESVSS